MCMCVYIYSPHTLTSPHPIRLLGEPTLALRAATSIAEVAPRGSQQLLRGAWLALALGEAPWALRLASRSLEEREETRGDPCDPWDGGKDEEDMGKIVKLGDFWREFWMEVVLHLEFFCLWTKGDPGFKLVDD